MKKRFFVVATAALISGSVMFSSCIGSFALVQKVHSWNTSMGNKFVNELVFLVFCIVPVYEVASFLDVVLLNTIEFWTGDNPVAAGEVKTIRGDKDTYRVETLADGYKITNSAGAEMNLVIDRESNTWSAVTGEVSTKLIKVEDSNSAVVYLANGNEQKVSLSAAGMLAFRQANNMNLFAVK
ncbi:MAG: DUF3332 domain-containing protein [Bacteroidales bacterium]|jgi:hypothetical protein|nr:DUF3332 domain-containing protein [Bacteroidales bacterium]